MGTALVLLFLLALGAMPGALLPQRSLNEFKVEQYIAEHPTIGPWLEGLQPVQPRPDGRDARRCTARP